MALANDGKYYAKGGSGKQFVYNPATGNIGVTDANGKTTYVTTSDPTYQATLGAMNADTGSNFGGSSYADIYNSAQAGYEAAKGNSVLQAQAATEAAGAAMNAGQPVNATPVSPVSTAPVNTPSNVPAGNNATVSIGGGRVVTPVSVGGSRVPSGNNAPASTPATTPAVKPATTPAVAPATTTPTTSIPNNLGGNTRVEQALGDTATGFTKNLIESSSPESTIIQLPTETATTPAAESGVASDGKYYGTGGTGKQFVYNPDTKNIGIMENGEWRYVMQGDDAYDATYAAMLADTGNMGGKLQGIVGEVVTEQQPADTIPTQQPVEPVMPQAPAAPEIYVPAIDDINDYDQLFGGYADTIVGTQNQQNAAIDAALAYQKYLLDQQRGSLAANKAAQDRDAYINYQRQINPYGYNAEALARMGLSNSGYSETALINYGNALMGAMQSNNISYYEGIQELERAKIEAQLEGDMNKAEIAADLQAQMAQTLLSLGQQKIQFEYQKYLNEQEAALNAEQMNLQRWMAEQEALAEQREADRDYELAQNELALKQQQINNDYAINQQKIQKEQEQAAYEKALQMAEMGDLSALEALGVDTSYYGQVLENNLGETVAEDESPVIVVNGQQYTPSPIVNGKMEYNGQQYTENEIQKKVQTGEIELKQDADGNVYVLPGNTENDKDFNSWDDTYKTAYQAKDGKIYVNGLNAYLSKTRFEKLFEEGHIVGRNYNNTGKFVYTYKELK